MCKVEQGSIIKSVFLYNFKCSNMEIGKTDESLRRKATGPLKWQPVAENSRHCLFSSAYFAMTANAFAENRIRAKEAEN